MDSKYQMKPKTHFGKYLTEVKGKNIYEADYGFATYSFLNDDCYIEDIYIDKEQRSAGKARELGNEIAKIAIAKGCKRLLGSVIVSVPNSTHNLSILMDEGYKLDSATNNFIVVAKDLTEKS